MRQILIEIPVYWLAIAALAVGAATLLYGLVRRQKDTILTGATIAAAVLVGGLFFWRKMIGSTLPIFGFGSMLFLAFLAANWVGTRVARQDGMDPEPLVDMGLWVFIWGIIGARVLFMIRNPAQFEGLLAFFKIWQGGIVFYGGVISGLIVFLYYVRRYRLMPFRVLDVFAPALAVGIAVGRIGCLLNGCCWGAPSDLPWAMRFPYGSIPHVEQVITHSDRVSLGFHFSNLEGSEPLAASVDTGSWAKSAGLQRGDVVRRVGDLEVVRTDAGRKFRDGPALLGLMRALKPGSDIALEVDRGGRILTLQGTFEPQPPHSLPVHPTQIYLALSGAGLVALTLVYFPRRRRPGEVMALMMIGYSVSRFAIEFFRDDEPVWLDGLTISQNISIVILVGGFVLWGYLRRQPPVAVSIRSVASRNEPQPGDSRAIPSHQPAGG